MYQLHMLGDVLAIPRGAITAHQDDLTHQPILALRPVLWLGAILHPHVEACSISLLIVCRNKVGLRGTASGMLCEN